MCQHIQGWAGQSPSCMHFFVHTHMYGFFFLASFWDTCSETSSGYVVNQVYIKVVVGRDSCSKRARVKDSRHTSERWTLAR